MSRGVKLGPDSPAGYSTEPKTMTVDEAEEAIIRYCGDALTKPDKEVRAILEAARSDGYNEGFDEGMSRGKERGEERVREQLRLYYGTGPQGIVMRSTVSPVIWAILTGEGEPPEEKP